MAGGLIWLNGVPFSDEIMADKPPPNICPLNFEYDGTTDPWDHLNRFENYDLLHRFSDGIKCRLFLTTLTKSALAWPHFLPEKSIHSFEDLSVSFLKHFQIRIRKYRRSPETLWCLNQREGESLRSFTDRFAAAALEVPGASRDALYFAFVHGLREGEFTQAQDVYPPGDFNELMDEVEKRILFEEGREMRRAGLEDRRVVKKGDAEEGEREKGQRKGKGKEKGKRKRRKVDGESGDGLSGASVVGGEKNGS